MAPKLCSKLCPSGHSVRQVEKNSVYTVKWEVLGKRQGFISLFGSFVTRLVLFSLHKAPKFMHVVVKTLSGHSFWQVEKKTLTRAR